MNVCVYGMACMYVCLYGCMYVCMHECMQVCMSRDSECGNYDVCMNVMYACMHAYIYMYE